MHALTFSHLSLLYLWLVKVLTEKLSIASVLEEILHRVQLACCLLQPYSCYFFHRRLINLQVLGLQLMSSRFHG